MNASTVAPSSFQRFQPKDLRNHFRIVACMLIATAMMLSASTVALAATYTVTSNADTSTGSGTTGTLRYVIGQATDGDTVVFSNVVGTITLVNGSITINHNITITGPGPGFLTVSGNHASQILVIGGTVTISGLTFADADSASSYGGAMYNVGNLTLENCIFSNNTNESVNGGAIYNAGILTVDNSVFTGNTTAAGGGAIANGGTTLTVVGSTFSGNTAAAGAGILNNAGTATVENSTFTGNSVSGGGPGAGLFNNASMTVENTTVANNLSGGGVWNNGGSITLTNSIVSGNVGGDCPNCGTQASNNLIGGAANLGPLQFNGGATQTMMPLPGSPIIGAGASCLQNTDQRGFARPTAGACDLGAVETNYYTVTNLNDSGAGSLRNAINTVLAAGSGDVVFQSGVTGTIEIASSLPMVTSPVNIAGPGANQVTISGAMLPPGGPGGMLTISGAGASANLSGLTFANSGSGDIEALNGSHLTLSGCAFLNNAGGGSGSMVLDNDGSSVLVVNSTFNGNQLGAILFNNGPTSVVNSTFTGNSAPEGGAIYNEGLLKVSDSTIDGNSAGNAGYGGGIYNYPLSGATALYLANNIVSNNTSGTPAAPDDCANCGTQSPSNMIGGSPALSPLQYNGVNATVQTMIPLPGSPAIQGSDATQVPWFAANDERGFPRLTDGKLDLGAVQTNYTSVNFIQQPTNTLINATISPSVTVNVLETNPNLTAPNNTDAVAGIPITLALSGTGTLSGTLTQTTGSVAAFNDLKVNAAGTGNELKTSIAVTGTQTLTAASSAFDITLQAQTITFTSAPPANATYGDGPVTLAATSSAGLPVTFQVDSGPVTIQGNVLTYTGAGTVVIEADAAGNGSYSPAPPVTKTITVAKAATTLNLTSSAEEINVGQAVTLTATVTSSAQGSPTGTVTFLNGSTSLGTANLDSQGVATLVVPTLQVGSVVVTASYAGDANFASSQGQLSGNIVVTPPPTFILTSPVTGLVVLEGQSRESALTVASSNGYNGTVNFSCSGLPVNTTCSFAPASVTFNGGANTVTVLLKITTNVKANARSSVVAQMKPLNPLQDLPILPAIFFWLPGTGFSVGSCEDEKPRKAKSKVRKLLWIVVLMAVGASALAAVGCGANFQTPKGEQTITVTANGSGGISQSVSLQLTVQ